MSARKTVKFTLDPKNPPPLTAEQRKRLKAVAAMPDAQIDYSDIPRQTGGEVDTARKRLKGSVLSYDKPLDPAIPADEWDVNR